MELIPPRAGELIGDSTDRRIELLCDDDALHATWSRFGPRRNGASLHVHHHHADLFYVLAGELTMGLGLDGSAVASAGTLVYVPPLVVHGFRNAADHDVRYLNFHAPGRGFADYLRAGRDGTEGSFDQAEPPPDGGRSPEAARIGEATLVADEIEVHERELEPGAALHSPTARRLLCLYVLEGSLALTDGVQAETGTWVRLSEPRELAGAGAGPVRFLEIHV